MADTGGTRLLAGSVIAVTGAGQGLGRAYALACAEHGARVVVNDVHAETAEAVVAEILAGGGQAVPVAGSVADWDTGAALVERARRAFGRIDGLVNNAGVKHEAPPWAETERELRRVVEVNVLGTQFCARHVLAALVEDGVAGSVVNVVSGARHGIAGMGAYGASKGAVDAMTATWAVDCAAAGIRVNAVSPLAMTAMAAQDLRPDRPALAAPERIAGLVVALLSDETSAVTGHVFRYDGTTLSAYRPPALAPIAEQVADDPLSIAGRITRWAGTRHGEEQARGQR